MPTISAENPVDAVKEMLSDSSNWTNTAPNVRYLWEDAPSERGPGDGQPPVIYVWSPTNTDVERFSADADENDETASVEVVIFTLEDSDSGLLNKQYQSDTVQILGEYANDNEANTVFTDTRVTAKDDRRNEYLTRDTNHHVTTVEVDPRGLFSATN
jgi:hypothetical protein